MILYMQKDLFQSKQYPVYQEYVCTAQWRIQDLILGGGGAWTLSTGGGVIESVDGLK